ncbi:MAG: hypothetical protein V4625_10230 [Pseudomonadota bacterium]
MANKHEHLSAPQTDEDVCPVTSAAHHPIYEQCLRVLRCTARAMANSPGGLRFKAGTRPWLEGLDSMARGRAAPALSTFGDAA